MRQLLEQALLTDMVSRPNSLALLDAIEILLHDRGLQQCNDSAARENASSMQEGWHPGYVVDKIKG